MNRAGNYNYHWLVINWQSLSNEIPYRWPKLTNLDLEVLQGRPDKIVDTLKVRYHLTQAEAERELERLKTGAR